MGAGSQLGAKQDRGNAGFMVAGLSVPSKPGLAFPAAFPSQVPVPLT
jgi:hypothetical protein